MEMVLLAECDIWFCFVHFASGTILKVDFIFELPNTSVQKCWVQSSFQPLKKKEITVRILLEFQFL